MSDTRWAKVESCGDCGHYFRCAYAVGVEHPSHDPIHPNCPLSRAGDIPEVKRLVEAAITVHGKGVEGLVQDKDNPDCWLILMNQKAWANLRDALAAFDKGDKGEEAK